MGLLQRILKNLGAMFTGNLASTVITLAEPAVFLHSYGTAPYADWIILTATVTALNNLNFGLQTYVNQDLAVRLNRGDREGFKVQQSTALRLLVGILLVAAAVCLVVFFLPMEHLIGMKTLTHRATTISVYLIALQVLIGNLLFGYFAGNFMSVGMAHRGNYWVTAQRLTAAFAVYACALMHMTFPVLAGVQFGAYALCLAGILVDQHRVAPEITPSLRYWDGSAVRPMLKQSGYFGLIQWSNFFCYQLPLIILQRSVGAFAVVAFSMMRKIFGLGRQVLNGITQSMGPEITRLFGREDWDAMGKLYDYSERLVFALTAVLNVSMLIASPILLEIWLRRPNLFLLGPYILVCVINIVLCLKEHKYQFQVSTNTHRELARIMFSSYVVMTLALFLVVPRFGINGFLLTWLAVELFQTVFIIRLNQKLFTVREEFSIAYVLKLAALSAAMLGVCAAVLRRSVHLHYPAQCAAAAGVIMAVAAASFWVFHLNRMSEQVRARLRRRFSN
jgi:O-antigen/teichoic acid export membrane protein